MHVERRQLRSRLLTAVLVLLSLSPAFAADKPRLRADDYTIDAELQPKTHKITAKAKVKITALEDISIATFELNNGLRPTKITDANGKVLTGERVAEENAIRVPLPEGLSKGQSTTLTFEYEGTLASVEDSPVEGLKLASIGDDTTYLLYAGRWFPVVNYGIDRFTAAINVTVPAFFQVVGSGAEENPAKGEARPAAAGMKTYSFDWTKPSFPGTIIAGSFVENSTNAGGLTIRTFFKPNKRDYAAAYSETAAKEFEYFSTLYGPPASTTINIVELPDDTVPNAWAPEIVGLASRNVQDKVDYRLLADTLAHQWWGVDVSAASKNDYWIVDGFARDSELRYVESVAGEAGFQDATKDIEVGALAYDTIPLADVGKLDMFSPQFQSMVTDKGAAILHMLRWVVGDATYTSLMRTFATQYAGKPATTDQFRAVAEQVYKDKLTSFFAQWFDGTGAPDFQNKYSIYRIAKGFRVVGEITQDLDLFRMPVEVRVETDGKTETQRIEVEGTKSPYTIETFGKPRKITIDPNNWVLKNTDDVKVMVAIRRGQELVAQGDFTEALKEFNHALESKSNSSLAHYRIAEVFFLQRNYQASANAYREALNGDGDPRWTEVWSHIQLGKIFDVTGQRERATNEYRQALQTNDNTQGALDEAHKYLNKPYQGKKDSGD